MPSAGLNCGRPVPTLAAAPGKLILRMQPGCQRRRRPQHRWYLKCLRLKKKEKTGKRSPARIFSGFTAFFQVVTILRGGGKKSVFFRIFVEIGKFLCYSQGDSTPILKKYRRPIHSVTGSFVVAPREVRDPVMENVHDTSYVVYLRLDKGHAVP